MASNSMNELKQKNYLILGGTSGIGFSLAKKLSKDSLVSVIGRDPSKVEKENNKNIICYQHEIRDFEITSNFLESKIDQNKFDGIFISVGIERFKRLGAIKKQDFDEIFLPPISSLLAVLKLSANGKLLNQNSSIVVMSSVSSVRGKSSMSLYGSSRAAIESLVIHSSNELAKRKIRVNAIRAGAFKGDMHDRITKDMTDIQIKSYEKPHLLGFGNYDDISEMAIYLLSEKARWFTGSIINLDGGFLAK